MRRASAMFKEWWLQPSLFLLHKEASFGDASMGQPSHH